MASHESRLDSRRLTVAGVNDLEAMAELQHREVYVETGRANP